MRIQTGRGTIPLITLVGIWSISALNALPGLAVSPILGKLSVIFPHSTELDIQTASMQVWRDGEEISLTKTEYELLLLFARNPRRAMYRETIYERVWGEEYPFGSKAVDLHIQRLRKKIGWENCLRAVNKVGYRLEVEP